MDDGLVLNLAVDEPLLAKTNNGKKGGRWTDRVKAKRVANLKRKDRSTESSLPSKKTVVGEEDVEGQPPPKRARKDGATPKSSSTAQAPRPPGQIISSLFSYNPAIERPEPSQNPKVLSRPSNAPLTDSSTFSGLGLNPLIVSHLSTKMNLSTPTSIQRAALPYLLSSASTDTLSRDVFIQSQTGSGKTLAFLLPIVQDLLPLSSLSYIDRSIGTLAVIIAPTRELAKQISDVLELLLTLRLRPPDQSADDADPSSARLTRWLVSGLLTGGSTRTHEKARLRKGVPILVSTPKHHCSS